MTNKSVDVATPAIIACVLIATGAGAGLYFATSSGSPPKTAPSSEIEVRHVETKMDLWTPVSRVCLSESPESRMHPKSKCAKAIIGTGLECETECGIDTDCRTACVDIRLMFWDAHVDPASAALRSDPRIGKP